jgi:hypothetical protein
VDLYSGRPNPRFPLGPTAGSELIRRIEALPRAHGGQPRDGLGYRGLRIQTEAGAEIVVSGGVVMVRDPDRSPRWLRDPDRALERWLVDQGEAGLDPAVMSALSQDLAR